jgi:hypothetical protein
MDDITRKIHEKLQIEPDAYWMTHNRRNLPNNKDNNKQAGRTIQEGETIVINIKGKGGMAARPEKRTAIQALQEKAAKDRADKQRKSRDKGLILEQARKGGQTVPCTVTWDPQDEEQVKKLRGLQIDYLEYFELNSDQGTAAARNQLVMDEKNIRATIRPTRETRGNTPVMSHNYTGTILGQNTGHWDVHVYKAYMEAEWGRTQARQPIISRQDCYERASTGIRTYEETQKRKAQIQQERHEAQHGPRNKRLEGPGQAWNRGGGGYQLEEQEGWYQESRGQQGWNNYYDEQQGDWYQDRQGRWQQRAIEQPGNRQPEQQRQHGKEQEQDRKEEEEIPTGKLTQTKCQRHKERKATRWCLECAEYHCNEETM